MRTQARALIAALVSQPRDALLQPHLIPGRGGGEGGASPRCASMSSESVSCAGQNQLMRQHHSIIELQKQPCSDSQAT